jgi:hypothetical protein
MVEQDTLDWDHMEEAELEKLWEKYGETVVTNPDVLAQEDLDDTDSKECKWQGDCGDSVIAWFFSVDVHS